MKTLTLREIVELGIKAEEDKIARLEEFLEDFSLETPVNRTVALELAWVINRAEKTIENFQERLKWIEQED